MSAVRRTKTMELVWKIHAWLYRQTSGRVGGTIMGMPVLLLTTTGRRTGQSRTTALMYLPKDPACVVVGSNAGEPWHPAWCLNLRANPKAHVQRGATVTAARAREAKGDERARLWAEIVERESSFQEYQRRTTRRIPIVVLEPE